MSLLASIWDRCNHPISLAADAVQDDAQDSVLGQQLFWRPLDARCVTCACPRAGALAMMSEHQNNSGFNAAGVGVRVGLVTTRLAVC